MNSSFLRILCFAFCFILTVSCKKLVTVSSPVTSITEENVYQSDATANAVLIGIYINLSPASLLGGVNGIPFLTGLTGDELTLGISNATYQAYYSNNLSSTNTGGQDLWNNIYPQVYIANAAIEGISTSGSLTPAVKNQLLGEAEFMRAFFYFYLTNLYGDVPLVTSTDYKANGSMARTPAAEVYKQMINDLTDAQSRLTDTYVDGAAITNTTERTRPNKWAATALLARVYLFTGDWTDAEIQASKVINNTGLCSLVPNPDSVFFANSNEAIWQIQPTILGGYTADAQTFLLPPTGVDYLHPASLSDTLLNSFEADDLRKIDWIDSVSANSNSYYFASKYKSSATTTANAGMEYSMVLRLAEQYLIRAEAEANGAGNGIPGAISDLDTIRSRAGLANYAGPATPSALEGAILHERQVELFTEWGHRWFDMKRATVINTIMSIITPEKGGTWSSDWQWYPIPESTIRNDPNIVQNPGYN